jgi:hypothetical protein
MSQGLHYLYQRRQRCHWCSEARTEAKDANATAYFLVYTTICTHCERCWIDRFLKGVILGE